MADVTVGVMEGDEASYAGDGFRPTLMTVRGEPTSGASDSRLEQQLSDWHVPCPIAGGDGHLSGKFECET